MPVRPGIRPGGRQRTRGWGTAALSLSLPPRGGERRATACRRAPACEGRTHPAGMGAVQRLSSCSCMGAGTSVQLASRAYCIAAASSRSVTVALMAGGDGHRVARAGCTGRKHSRRQGSAHGRRRVENRREMGDLEVLVPVAGEAGGAGCCDGAHGAEWGTSAAWCRC